LWACSRSHDWALAQSFEPVLASSQSCHSLNRSLRNLYKVISHLASGHSILLLDALRTLDDSFKWSVDFWIVANHSRPIPEFKPAVVLVSRMEPEESTQVFPVRVGRASGGGRGRARGRAGRGRRGRAAGAPAPAMPMLVAGLAPMGDAGGAEPLDAVGDDEAKPESDIETPSEESADSSIGLVPDEPEEDSPYIVVVMEGFIFCSTNGT
jgi:hypothetical protein